MEDNRLSERKQKILRAIIEAHIAYGEPVGSRYLSESHDLGCSPATIRNEMAELEDKGYLIQPYTSAGRIPSELGYRFYVDSLIERCQDATSRVQEADRLLQSRLKELDRVLSEATQFAARHTRYTGISLRPGPVGSVIGRLENVWVTDRSFVMVMIQGDGTAKTRLMHLNVPLSAEELSRLTAFLNDRLAGKRVDEITLRVIVDIESRTGASAADVREIVRAVYEMMAGAEESVVRVEGLNNLLQYPEYADTEKLRAMLEMLERHGSAATPLMKLTSADASSESVQVYIGKENAVDAMNNSALVFRNIRKDGKVVGAIGIIGPCRMDYSKVISVIDRLAREIDSMIED